MNPRLPYLPPGRLFSLILLLLTVLVFRPGSIQAAAPLAEPPPVTASQVKWEIRLQLLRDADPREVSDWTHRLAQTHHDIGWMRDSLRHSSEGWTLRHTRLVLIRRTLLVTTGLMALLALLAVALRAKGRLPPLLSRAAITLTLFLLFNSVAVNLLQLYTDRNPVLCYTDALFKHPAHQENDSWKAILMAARQTAVPEPRTIYQALLADHGIKFQYPLTSTLLVAPFRNYPVTALLNAFCFALAWVIAALLAWILVRGLGEFPHPRGQRLPAALFGFLIAAGFTFTYYPILRGLLLGQVQTVIVTLFTGAVLAYLTGRPSVAGILIGLACTIKPQLGFLLLWGLTRKEYRFIAWAGLTATVLGLISIGVYGLRNNLDYIRVLLYLGNHGEAFYANQTVNGLLNRAFFLGRNLNWDGVAYPAFNVWVTTGTLLSSLGLVLWALLWRRARSPHSPALVAIDFSMAALAATMAAPIAWEHHYGLMLPMLALAFPLTLRRRDKTGLLLLALSVVLVSHSFAVTHYLANTHLNILQTSLFFGALLFMIQLTRLRRQWGNEEP